jgi:hypothetical protein
MRTFIRTAPPTDSRSAMGMATAPTTSKRQKVTSSFFLRKASSHNGGQRTGHREIWPQVDTDQYRVLRVTASSIPRARKFSAPSQLHMTSPSTPRQRSSPRYSRHFYALVNVTSCGQDGSGTAGTRNVADDLLERSRCFSARHLTPIDFRPDSSTILLN